VTSSPLTVTCSVPGTTSVVNTVPSGTPAGAVWLFPTLGGPGGSATALIDGQYTASESMIDLGLHESASASGTGSTIVSPHDYTLTLQAAVPTPVLLRIDWMWTTDANQTMPLAQVDVGDDGIVDFQGFASGQVMTVPLVIGTTPFHVRTRTAMSVSQGNVYTVLTCHVTPDLATSTAIPSTGCSNNLTTVATFEHELVLRMPIPVGLQWMVIGFSSTSLQLPWSTCLLRATPDIVLPLTQNELRIDLLTVPTGPFTFFAQGLVLLSGPNPLLATTLSTVHVQ
jgi:hypothetical protein